jgi:hypothetical protein
MSQTASMGKGPAVKKSIVHSSLPEREGSALVARPFFICEKKPEQICKRKFQFLVQTSFFCRLKE